MRREFSRKVKRAAYERSNGKCEMVWAGKRCNASLEIYGVQYDHIDPSWFSGDADLSNCQAICVPCHKIKTAADLKKISKSKRIRDRRIGALKSKRPMPFSRGSKFKRRMDGTVVIRATGQKP